MDFIDIHTHKKYLVDYVFSIENKYPKSTGFSTPFSIGIHPWYIKQNNIENELLIIEEKLQYKNCYAIGECGLDKLQKQILNFRRLFLESKFNFQKNIENL